MLDFSVHGRAVKKTASRLLTKTFPSRDRHSGPRLSPQPPGRPQRYTLRLVLLSTISDTEETAAGNFQKTFLSEHSRCNVSAAGAQALFAAP